MLKYKIGSQPFAFGGPLGDMVWYPPSYPNAPSYIDLPDDFLPSATWTGTDAKSKKAIQIAKDVYSRKVARANRLETLLRNNQIPNYEKDPLLAEITIPAPFNRKWDPPPPKEEFVEEPHVPGDLAHATVALHRRDLDREPV